MPETLSNTLIERVDKLVQAGKGTLLSTTPSSDVLRELAARTEALERAVREIALEVAEALGSALARVLVLEQAPHVPADREQEDERLLAVHHDAAEVLVPDRRQPPEPWRVLVERVERPAREDEGEPEERRRDEPGAEIRERRRRREPAGDERPPEEEAAEDEQRVLDVERPAGAERPFVEARNVRAVPGGEPRRQCVARAQMAQRRGGRASRASPA